MHWQDHHDTKRASRRPSPCRSERKGSARVVGRGQAGEVRQQAVRPGEPHCHRIHEGGSRVIRSLDGGPGA